MKSFIFYVLLFISSVATAQVVYTGSIEKFPIEVALHHYDKDVIGAYTYSNFDEPIALEGKIAAQTLTLIEKDTYGKKKATITLNKYKEGAATLEGTWLDLRTKKSLKVTLKKNFDLEAKENDVWSDRFMIQQVALKDYYFKVGISKIKDEYYPKVTKVNIYEKHTDKMLQSFEVDCQLWGLKNIEVGDYNFDGNMDFAVFEASAAGANTTSLYFLYDPKTKRFFKSEIGGVSLEFDGKKKIVTENNQCCGGQQRLVSIYKVVDNKLSLLEEHCYKWSEKKQDMVEQKLQECK